MRDDVLEVRAALAPAVRPLQLLAVPALGRARRAGGGADLEQLGDAVEPRVGEHRLVAGTTTSRIAYSIVEARDATGIILLHPFGKSLRTVLLKQVELKVSDLFAPMAFPLGLDLP